MSKSNQTTIYVIFVVALLVAAGGGFLGGTVYQKGKKTTTAQTTTGSNDTGFDRGSRDGGFGSRLGSGGIGSVTAVSSTSITITSRTPGSTAAEDKTYAINASTAITNNDAKVDASSIAVGDTVLVTTGTSDTTTATAITVNPSFGGGGQQPPAPTSITQ